MRLEEITIEMFRKALDVYVGAAYQQAPLPLTAKGRVNLFRDSGTPLAELLRHDVVERIASDAEPTTVLSYGVRLGNDKYPHMKLMLKREAGDDFRFTVDTHDALFVVENSSPDALKARDLKAYNMQLKQKIESLWRENDLPAVDEA